MMIVNVKDEYHLSVMSREVIGDESLYKSFNFFGWIESPKIRAPSPEFLLTINVHDTCATFYDMVMAPF
jgi:hypothetical protein